MIAVLTVAALGAPCAEYAHAAVNGKSAAQRQSAPCTNELYLGAGGRDTQLYKERTGPGDGGFIPIGAATDFYNALGVNSEDRHIYAMTTRERLLQVGTNGTLTDLGTVTGLPDPNPGNGWATYNLGSFDAAGNYYVASANGRVGATRLFRIDVDGRAVDRIIQLSQPIRGSDFTHAEGFLWAADPDGGLERIEPSTGTVAKFPNILPSTNGYGGAFTYGNGDLGFFDNNRGLLRVAVEDASSGSPDFELVSSMQSPAGEWIDAAACFDAPVDLAVTQYAPQRVASGDRITYKITVMNRGTADSSGWTLSDTLPEQLSNAETTSAGCEVRDGTLACTGGRLAAGKRTTVDVTATVSGTGNGITNTVTVRGNDPDPNERNNTASRSTRIDGEEASSLELKKRRSGGDVVRPGDVIKYTITVRNTGGVDYTEARPARFTDDIGDQLDDAVYRNDAKATQGQVAFSRPVLNWRGALAAGETATVTYSLKVKDLGDLEMPNSVVSDTPGNNCEKGSQDKRCSTYAKVTVKDKDMGNDTR